MAVDKERQTQEEREAEEAKTDPIRVETKRVVRRVGYALFFPMGFAVFLPAIFSVGVGISDKKVWDPFTLEPVMNRSSSNVCLGNAKRLLSDAREIDRLNPEWDRRYFTWVNSCRSKNADLFEVLRSTRSELHKAKQQQRLKRAIK